MTKDLTDADLQEIRRPSARTHLQLARRYGISAEAIDAIVRGRPWRHRADRSDQQRPSWVRRKIR